MSQAVATPPILRPSRHALKHENETQRLTLNAVFEIAKILTSAPDPIAAMPSVLNVLSSFLGLEQGALALLTEPDRPVSAGVVNPYEIAATTRGAAAAAPGDCAPAAVLGMVFRTGVPLVSLDLADEFGAEAVPPRLRGQGWSLIAIPVRESSRSLFVHGVLCAYRAHDDHGAGRADGDVTVLTMVASLLEQSLRFRNAIARDRERQIADTRRAISAATERLREQLPAAISIDGIIGDSPAIAAVVEKIRRVAGTRAAVLLRGESGTGKELFARAIHTLSDRHDKPFIRVNCAALSETLLESELFGHEKGAFTGAQAQKKGRFELADGGTLFLDEIGEISPAFQAKLLRVLQEGEFERVGGAKTVKADFRLVTATNRDLEEAVAHGDFRADLYFRICVVPIMLPPLRDRPGDIAPLAQAFLDRFNETNGSDLRFAADAFDTLCACKFPGNVRELENCVHRAAALSSGEVILGEAMACNQNACLSADLWRLQKQNASPIGGLASGEVISPRVVARAPVGAAPAPFAGAVSAPVPIGANPMPPGCPAGAAPRPRKTADTDREELVAAMEQAGWVQAKAARLLGMTPRQVAYALKKHEIEVKRI